MPRECPECSNRLRRIKTNNILYKIQKQLKKNKIGYYVCPSCQWVGILDREKNEPVTLI